MRIERYKDRYWAVWDDHGTLICITAYKKGAEEVVRRLNALMLKR